ncbi:putative Asparagine synthase family protein [Hibiscus syriacus]|uniref:Asparagine synthase family protein n=1 Tax=Hibiscus syriacus TaxID=106335 RepID=A0A6A2YUJ7_HIBSY|nr:putative Asparagine synthase family protein [Hibiscus syriacus]
MSAVKRSTDASENLGAVSLTVEDWKHSKSVVGPSITIGVTVDIPNVNWDDIEGLKDLKKKLQQAVEWPIKHSAAFASLGHNLCSCACLKTLQCTTGAELFGGESSRNGSAVGERLLSTLLTEMDGDSHISCNQSTSCSRCCAHVLYVLPPTRYEVLVHTHNIEVRGDVDLKRIAEDTALFTGAELEGLCREAGIAALRENISATVVSNQRFETVKKSLKPALTRDETESYSSSLKNQGLMSSPAGTTELKLRTGRGAIREKKSSCSGCHNARCW